MIGVDPCRSEILAIHRLGDGNAAVFLQRDAPPLVVPEPVAAALDTLRRFRRLDHHLAAATNPGARALIVDAAHRGVLVHVRDVLTRARAVSAAETSPVPRTIGVLTCDRPDALRRCVTSFSRAARDVRFVVVDDSRSAANIADNRRVLAELDGEVIHADLAAKRDYARRLASRAGVEPRIAELAVIGTRDAPGSIGANRNTLMLACAGDVFAMTDDDTEARVAKLADTRDVVRFTEQADPMAYRFCDSRAAAIDAVTPVDADICELHATALGKRIATLACSSEVDLDDATPPAIAAIADGTGRVAVTILGIYGDSGMFAGAGFLTHWLDGGQPRGDDAAYRRAVTSRELVRVAPCTVIRRSPPLMSTSLAIDHRELLPPFMPMLRDEDGVFGAMLAACCERAYVAHLPRAILHAAAPGRSYDPDRITSAKLRRFSNAVIELVRATGFGPGSSSVRDRLATVGHHLRQLAACSDADAMATIRALHVRAAIRRISRVETALRSQEAPTAWRADARAYVDTLRDALASDSFYEPCDVDGPDRVSRMRRLLGQLGELLEAWPALVEAARDERL
jgi:hypothetical protein